MEIEMKPVKCGDCFVVTSNQDTLIIDCGSDNAGNGLKKSQFAYSKIENLIMGTSNNLELLITHFDADHYNGILEFNDIRYFKNIYIPYYFSNNGEIVESIGYILAFAKDKTHASLKIKKLIQLFLKFPKILSLGGTVQCIRAGNKIDLGTEKLDVVWPETKFSATNNYWKYRLDTIEKVIKSFFENLRTESENEIDLSLESIEKRIQKFGTALITYIEACGVENEDIFLTSVNELEKQFKSLLEVNDILNQVYRNLEDTLENRLLKVLDYYEMHLCIRETHNELIRDMNSSSIVLHRKNDVLFLGDVSPTVIEELVRDNKISKKYKVVKFQHHATERYYTPNMPGADIALISNGGYMRRRVHQAFLNQAKELYCTDAWRDSRYCSYVHNNNKCSTKCIQLRKKHKSIIV